MTVSDTPTSEAQPAERRAYIAPTLCVIGVGETQFGTGGALSDSTLAATAVLTGGS